MRSLTLALVAVLVLALKRAFELVLEKEYATWAPALARLLVRAAGFVYLPRRKQWRADLRYMQQVEGGSGLLPAGWCLLSAPWLMLRHLVGASSAICWRQWKERVSFANGLLVAGVITTLIGGLGGAGPQPVVVIQAVAFSPDGQLLASGASDGKVQLWDVASRQPLGEPLTGHTDRVNGLAFSPDGRTIASASDDGTVRLWKASTGKPIGHPLTGHTSGVNGVAFSPDGRTIASASDDGTVRLWKASTGKPIGHPLTGHTSGVNGVAFSPDGRTITSAGTDGTVRQWEVSTGKEIPLALTGPPVSVVDVAFGPDGKTVASGGVDGTVRLWEPSTGKPIGQPLTSPDGRIFGVAFGPDGKTVASGGVDGTVRLWEPSTGKPIGQPLTGHTDRVLGVAFSPDGRTIATSGDGGKVGLWDLARRSFSKMPREDPLPPPRKSVVVGGMVLSLLASLLATRDIRRRTGLTFWGGDDLKVERTSQPTETMVVGW